MHIALPGSGTTIPVDIPCLQAMLGSAYLAAHTGRGVTVSLDPPARLVCRGEDLVLEIPSPTSHAVAEIPLAGGPAPLYDGPRGFFMQVLSTLFENPIGPGVSGMRETVIDQWPRMRYVGGDAPFPKTMAAMFLFHRLGSDPEAFSCGMLEWETLVGKCPMYPGQGSGEVPYLDLIEEEMLPFIRFDRETFAVSMDLFGMDADPAFFKAGSPSSPLPEDMPEETLAALFDQHDGKSFALVVSRDEVNLYNDSLGWEWSVTRDNPLWTDEFDRYLAGTK